MLNYINQALNLIDKSSVVFVIILSICFYWKIKSIDKKIEILNKEFDKKREEIRSQPIAMPFIDGQTKTEKRNTDEAIAPLERERQRIISKIPFIK